MRTGINLITIIPLFCILELSISYKIQTKGDAIEYLSHFGYLPENDLPIEEVPLDEAREGLKDFQDLANLNPNGRLNRRTLKEMNRPRCGNRDLRISQGDELGIDFTPPMISKREVKVRHRRDDSPGVRWHKTVLTYRIIRFSSKSLKPKPLQKEIDLAFKYWERQANITFKKVWEGTSDIKISFVSGDHGDEESFDGPSKTLAHAFYPARGDIHFDDAEKWTANGRHGHNLRTVAVHEIGHALGLGHSKERKSVMYLMYQGFKDKLELHVSDINAIQSLYGPKIAKEMKNQGKEEILKHIPKLKNLEEMIENPLNLCAINRSFDAISTLSDDHIYIFKGDYYYKMKMGGTINYEIFPKRINDTFNGLPSNLDTVLTISNGKTYFFKGKQYWRSTGVQMDAGYPKRIKTNFIGLPNNLDGALVWSWNNLVYFFKKNRYWRYNFDTPNKKAEYEPVEKNKLLNKGKSKRGPKLALIPNYPKRISTNWPGIPDDIDDGFKAPNGRTYLFKRGEYWQFHDPESTKEASSYPRSTGDWWFGCSDFKPDARRIRHVRRRKPYNYL